MIVNIEFFDEEPIENVITNLNFELDKTIFFGYEEIMKPHKKTIETFLKKVCGVQSVEFYSVDRFDLMAIMGAIANVVRREQELGNQVYFDLTGGESLLLVAFGILSQEFSAPMFMFDIQTNELIEFCCAGNSIGGVAVRRPIILNLDQFVSLYNGTINYRQKKLFKEMSLDGASDIENMWKLSREHGDKWVHYSSVLRKYPPDESLMVEVDRQRFQDEFRKHHRAGDIKDFHKFMHSCSHLGFVKLYAAGKNGYKFRYKNSVIKQLFWDSGSILEMYTFLQETRKEGIADCRVGVHIDWDGVVHESGNQDVLNEIDVMSIQSNLPTFISCKIGNVDQTALYELETIANRFGGKYARKVIAVSKELTPAHARRAKEMGIEVWVME
ncbi:MAG: DUF1887 family protein [Lachnospiraceae bacterium]|nr:DUF1887 family protein [Lachnospiraceae bacterium]